MRSLTSALVFIAITQQGKKDQTKKNDSHGGDKMCHFEFIIDNDRNGGKLSKLHSSFMTHNSESGG